MASSIRSKVIAVVAGCCVSLIAAAVLFPIFAHAKVSMGPNVVGAATSATRRMKTYYEERPGKIEAWTSRSGAPTWWREPKGGESGRGSWRYLESRLRSEEAELSIDPRAVGRRWADLSDEDPVLIATFRKRPSVEIPKSGWDVNRAKVQPKRVRASADIGTPRP